MKLKIYNVLLIHAYIESIRNVVILSVLLDENKCISAKYVIIQLAL